MADDKKYEFTGETKTHLGRTLKQIRALVAIAAIGVDVGQVGGWIESEQNLDHSGNAWVSGNARVYGNAQVSGNAQVYGNARVYGDAQVYGNAQVYGDAWVSGNAWVYGDARVYGNAQVYGDARVYVTPACATRSDGYTFTLVPTPQGPRIIAGCRYFTFAEANKHWRKTRGGTPLGDESLAIVTHLRAMAKINGADKKVLIEREAETA